MSPERAAEVLGVAVDAPPLEVEHAFQRRARRTHPDLAHPELADADARAAGDGFHEAAEARRTLLAPRPARAEPGLRMREVRVIADGPRPQGPGLIAVWAGLLLVAAFLSIFQGSYPLTIAEPLVRWAALIGGAIGFAVTGRRGLAVLAIVAEVASVAIAVSFTTFGELLALLITLPALLGAFTGGIVRYRLRRALAAAT